MVRDVTANLITKPLKMNKTKAKISLEKHTLTLGVETSCDETGVALYHGQYGLLAHRLFSQIELHAAYGGVVPELASRDHVHRLLPLINACLNDAQADLSHVGAVAYTQGPGLAGALLTGASTARALAFALDIPAIGVHHMEGHLLAPFLEREHPKFPFIALLVSGGHTQIILVKAIGEYQMLGETIDDAAGEAFDKTAKLLDLGYPGGPVISQLAQQGESGVYHFPRPMTDRPGLDMSFSGLKTAVLQTWLKAQDSGDIHVNTKANIARAFQEAMVETLSIKLKRALESTGINQLVIAGGVGANRQLREAMKEMMEKRQGEVFYPRAEFCTDNGAMIAYAGHCRLKQAQRETLSFQVSPRWPLEQLSPVSAQF